MPTMIPYNSISIENIYCNHIQEVEIYQKISEHGTARIKIEVFQDKVQKLYDYMTEMEGISIKANNTTVFCGVIQSISVDYLEMIAIADITLISTTILLDTAIENHSYQRTSATYSEIVEKALNGRGSAIISTADLPTRGLILQYEETAWQFIKRIVNEWGTYVFAMVNSEQPTIQIGQGGAANDDFLFAGTVINGKCVTEVTTKLVNGMLRTEYRTEHEQNLMNRMNKNYAAGRFCGKIFKGVVISVNIDTVKVFLPDIDASFDAGGDWVFPYSTLYSTKDGDGGFYMMPVAGDPVRVFFPSEHAEEAFAASSGNVRGTRPDYHDKCYESPKGMQVLYTKDGLLLSCNGKRVFIDLLKDQLNIRSNENINLVANENLRLQAANRVDLVSKESVYVGTKEAFVYLSNENGGRADVFSKQIFLR